MSGERLMPDNIETGKGAGEPALERPTEETAVATTPADSEPKNVPREQKFTLTPEQRDRYLEENNLEFLKEFLSPEKIDNAIYNIEKNRQVEGGKKPLPPGQHYETIKNQFLQDVQVEWPNDRQEAEKWIRKILGEIEISKDDIDQQIQIDYKNANDILEVLSRKIEDRNWLTGQPMKPDEILDQQKWAKKMRGEIKARLKLHASFMKYENGGSIKEVHEAMLGLYGGWLNAVFELKETSSKTQEEFNPFVEALQYYEDHGHEFARHNSEEDRPVFGKRVMEDLQRRFGGEAANYEWASNMAERLFRATGRAIMYDYLVINKDTPNEKMVPWDYEGPEKADWASGRDGCDYPMSKIYRFRENMKSEEGLMRGQIHLLDGADILAGDFWTRTTRESFIKLLAEPGQEPKPLFRYRNKDENGEEERIQILKDRLKEQYLFEGLSEEKAQERIKKAIKGVRDASIIELSSEQEKDAIIKARKEELMKKGIDLETATKEANAYFVEIYQADIYGDRPDDNNFGEVIGKINFRLMDRVVKKVGDEEVLISGIDFIKMGATPMSLWVSRMLDGPESAKDPLAGSREAYLLNPNFKTLGKLLACFDYSKANTWKVKEQLVKNYIKYAQSDAIEATGRRKLTDEEIIAGVNELSGYTDPNAPQFIQPQERAKILKDFMHIKISEEENAKLDQMAREQAEKQILDENPGLNASDPEFIDKVKNRTLKIKAKLVNNMINSRIEHNINIKFAASFAGNFVLGGVKAGLKQALAELGLK